MGLTLQEAYTRFGQALAPALGPRFSTSLVADADGPVMNGGKLLYAPC